MSGTSVQDITGALRELTAAVKKLTTAIERSLPKAEASEPQATAENSKDKHVPAVAQAKPKAEKPKVEELDYDKHVAPAARALAAAKGRAGLVSVLEGFQVEKTPQLDKSMYAEFIAACNKAASAE